MTRCFRVVDLRVSIFIFYFLSVAVVLYMDHFLSVLLCDLPVVDFAIGIEISPVCISSFRRFEYVWVDRPVHCVTRGIVTTFDCLFHLKN